MTLQGCSDCTDWVCFKDACSDLDELTETVTYMTFCEEKCIPHKLCTVFPNNKPWINKTVKSVLNQKDISYYQGDATQRGQEAKLKCKNKVGKELCKGNSCFAWEGIKSMMGMEMKGKKLLYLANLVRCWQIN